MTPTLFFLLPLLAVLAAGPAAAAEAGKDYAGIYCLPKGEKPGQQIDPASLPWAAPGVSGMALRSMWMVMEPKAGTRDWSYFDEALALAARQGKKISLSVAAGAFVPAWVKAEGALHLEVLQKPNFTTPQELEWVPSWDPVLQREWGAFVRAMAARYDRDPRVGYVYIGGAGLYIESYVVQTEADAATFNAAGGLEKWKAGTEALIDLYGDAFRTTPFLLAIGNPMRVPGWHAQGEAAVGEVVRYGLSRYPGRFGVASQGLNERSAGHGAGFFINRLIRKAAPAAPTGYQMVGPTSGRFIFGQPGNLGAALEGGLRLGARFIEVYQADCENPDDAALLASADKKLKEGAPR